MNEMKEWIFLNGQLSYSDVISTQQKYTVRLTNRKIKKLEVFNTKKFMALTLCKANLANTNNTILKKHYECNGGSGSVNQETESYL